MWRCKNCEHKNRDEDISCEICDGKRPVLKSCTYELSDVFGTIKVFWETDNAESVTIVKKKKKFDVDTNGSILFENCKNNEKIVFLLNNKFAEYQEDLVVLLDKPSIVLFELESTKLLTGASTQIKWKANNSTRTQILGIGKVDNEGITNLKVEKNPVKIITENEIGTVEKEIEVEFIPLPKIKFDCKRKIELGDILNLKWNVENALKSVLLYNESKKEIENIGDKEITLKETTTFKLIATALDSKTTIEKEITIEVFPKPEIKYFKVLPEVVISSQPVTLSWKVENAKKTEINHGVGKVAAEGEKNLLHDKNTLYTLTAVGELSTATKNIVVTVFPTPIIESLLVPMPDFSSSVKPLNIIAPKIDVSINLPDFNFNPPQFTKLDINLAKIKPLYKTKLSIFNFSKIYEYVRRNSRV
ncbi:MAG: hypothetical protein LBO74_01370 [Candidatus Symbiothrix sp.]|jgi:hypothetical protein|nr:hypothetical protein [Candidatus Symbiothrix sp.]